MTDTDIADDDILLFFEDADNLIRQRTGFEFESNQITEKHDGDDKNFLTLNHRPVIGVLSLTIDTTVITNYFLYTALGRVELKENNANCNLLVFTKGQQNVVVIYTYGITDERLIEIAKSLARDLSIRDMYKFVGAKKSGGIQSEKYIDYSLSYFRMPYFEQIKKLDSDIEKKFETLGREAGYRVF